MKIVLYSDTFNTRLNYTLDFIFKDILNFEYEFTNSLQNFGDNNFFKINYSKEIVQNADFNIPNLGFLNNIEILPVTFENGFFDEIPVIFYSDKPNFSINFDIFSAVFYLISRYEEYLPSKRDNFNRFLSTESVAFKNNFLAQPIIEIWCKLMSQAILNKYEKEIIFKSEKKFEWTPTFDIDLMWAIKHKPFLQNLFFSTKILLTTKKNYFKTFFQVYFLKKNDPFFTFDLIKKIHSLKKPIFFWLLASKKSKYDRNHSPKLSALKKLIQELNQEGFEIGIHPSMASNEDSQKLNSEINTLENIIQKKVLKSRQHFLYLTFPDTYRNLISNDIFEDYSMGYADAIGFRAGTCTPFYWFDLESNCKTNLKIFPFQVMDVTLKDYLKLSPEKAWDLTKPMINEIHNVNGNFISLWHNSSFSEAHDWSGWETFYIKMKDYCLMLENKKLH